MATKTRAYQVTIRRICTGCDYHIRLFANDMETAIERAKDRARFSEGIRKMDMANYDRQCIAVFRVVSCELSADQSRPITS